jgi:hypothetical protein
VNLPHGCLILCHTMPVLATTGGRRHLVVLHATQPPESNWQQQQQVQGPNSGLSPDVRIGMWVLFSITVLFVIIGLRRMLCCSSRIYGPGPQISGEGIRERRQQPTVAADIELAPAPVPALVLECTYRSAGGWAEQTCSVCLSELADGDIVRVLVVCKHCFHSACIEPWLRGHDTSPLCRAPTTANGGRNMGTRT